MQLEDLMTLLPHGENIDLDWKRTFPPGYFDKSDRSRYDAARAELVKDVAAMANAASEKVGHLVYGIADQNGQRVVHPVLRTEAVDDAALAQFLTKYLDPAPSFEYTEFQYKGQLVGLLRVHRVTPYPHVVRESLGSKIHKGQVFMRTGTGTDIAMHTDLVRMIGDIEPMVFVHNSPRTNELSAQLQAQGWRVSWVPDDEVEEYLLDGREYVIYPGTRRRIVSPTGNRAGLFQRQFLMRYKPATGG
jgi:Putative DNA-binding domain